MGFLLTQMVTEDFTTVVSDGNGAIANGSAVKDPTRCQEIASFLMAMKSLDQCKAKR
jgi:hypothetical protein